ncbi:MAG: peptide ABC transporter substrate-binding protein [Chloroflexia bacterium]|nr:peptide ABC transporter substrate-binding protein [Chloroflexia bacterium]
MRRLTRWIRPWTCVALLAMIGMLAGIFPAAAQEATPEASYFSDTAGPPQPGGMANFLLYENPDTLNPLIGQTTIAVQVTSAILEGLTYVDPDGLTQPALAAELPTLVNGGVSEDLTTVTWTLKPDLLWSDGTPVTSADVAHTWESARDADNGSAVASDYDLITGIETPDPQTAVVSYSAFNAGYLDQFPWIVPAHATGEPSEMATWDFNQMPIGTGPFVLQEWSSDEYLLTTRNENYREESKPYLDGINFLVIPAEEARAARMIGGDAQVMIWAGDEATDQIEAAGTASERTAPGVWVMSIYFNQSAPFDDDPGAEPPHPILGDLRVREAITLAINRDRIRTELFEDRVLPLDSVLQVGWINCEVEPFTYDPERAAQLLDEVGWRDEDGDGVREAHSVPDVEDGTPMTLNMNGYTGFSSLDLTELAVQEDLAAIGIEIAIENQDFAVIFGTWADSSPRLLGDYDLLLYDAGYFAEPGAEIERDFAPDQLPSADNPGGGNFYRWVRDDVGEWLTAANQSPDVDERRTNFCNVAGAIREDFVSFPLYQFREGGVYSNLLHGFTISTWEYATWDAENWWLEQ